MAEQEAQQAGAQAETTQEEASLLDQIVQEGRFGTEDRARERGRSIVKQFLSEVLKESITVSPDTATSRCPAS